jgi:hypothetical protein
MTKNNQFAPEVRHRATVGMSYSVQSREGKLQNVAIGKIHSSVWCRPVTVFPVSSIIPRQCRDLRT